MGFNSGFKGLKTQFVPRCKHFSSRYKNRSVYAVSGTNCCLFREKYKTNKYSVGRAYSCWMLNCWCTKPEGFKRLNWPRGREWRLNIWRSWDRASWYISIVKPSRCTIFEFIEYHSTCFGRSFRLSSGVQYCTYSIRCMSYLLVDWYPINSKIVHLFGVTIRMVAK